MIGDIYGTPDLPTSTEAPTAADTVSITYQMGLKGFSDPSSAQPGAVRLPLDAKCENAAKILVGLSICLCLGVTLFICLVISFICLVISFICFFIIYKLVTSS